METVTRKIGNSIGAIFPKSLSPKAGEVFTITKIDDTFIFKPKKPDIFAHSKDWEGFRHSVQEDREWDLQESVGREL